MKIRLFTDRKMIIFGVLVCTLFLSTFALAQSTTRRYPKVFHGNGARIASMRTCYNRARSALSGLKQLGSALSSNTYVEAHSQSATVLIRCNTTRSGIFPMIIVASNSRSASVGEQLWRRVKQAMDRTPARNNNTRRAANSTAISWSANAASKRGKYNQRFRYYCKPNGSSVAVWGTTYYTDDSSICAAAVHAGIIRRSAGGNVTIEIRPGRASYAATTRNGVTTRKYGKWTGSYVFVR